MAIDVRLTPFCALGLALLALASWGAADERPWIPIAPAQWQGVLEAEVPALSRRAAAAVALPAAEAQALTAATTLPQPPGLYELRVTLRPSHVADAIAFHAGVRVRLGERQVAVLPGQFFARTHQPETRVLQAAHTEAGPLAVTLEAFADGDVAERARVADNLRQGGPQVSDALAPDADPGLALETVLAPAKAVYYVVDSIAFRRLSGSGCVARIELDKIRYRPRATLVAQVTVTDVGGRGGAGRLDLHLEHLVNQRTTVRSLPVTLSPEPQTVAVELQLPEEELGYALVAEYVSADGIDRSEAAACFTIAANFQRVAIFGGGLATRDAVQDEETIRRGLAEARAGYFNATEFFAWAEDDLVEMSPDADFWSSGQTNYRMHKQTLQRQIRLAHEQGFAVATYGKYLMSGFSGWQTAYDYPHDHKGQYYYPVGSWLGCNTIVLDQRRHRDVRSYIRRPEIEGNAFETWWNTFLPINCDATPRMVRMAAEECARSVAMFGWDAVRWDGHPSVYSQGGRAGKYVAWGARQTQTLVRYFKDIVAQRHPEFRHGYNYLMVHREKDHEWAKEDYELDELCRGGGLLMNESIGNASGGYTFAQIARNLQVDGDLCRERGGYYLGISYAKSPRDMLVESALWAAAGCRPYNTAMTLEARRYCTRFAHYVFDEQLRRLTRPEKVLAPQTETQLWWQPFVYETPEANGRRQLVVNLLNLPLADKRPGRDSDAPFAWDLPDGTAPVDFALTLPQGLTAAGVTRIDPWSLRTEPLALAEDRFSVGPVALWSVLVIDLAAAPGAPSLGALYGPPATSGVTRPGVEPEQRRPEVVLAPVSDLQAAEKQFAVLQPDWAEKRDEEDARRDSLTGEELEDALRARKAEQSPEALEKEWFKGAAIPADLKLADNVWTFGDLAPRRNGRVDIYYARGAMDYRLRMQSAFARLERFQVHDAQLWGAVTTSPGMQLNNRVEWPRFPEFDVLLYTAVPHCAVGVENSYALVAYVKAGGAVFFTGGEFAFGKGGYMHTVLDRELLPVACMAMRDTIYSDPPRALEPGPDFAALGVEADFGARPSFWVHNQVFLKPGAKVFLQAEHRPILVGWTLGKGRVACLLLDHRGKSEDGVTAFFDWPEWPALMASVITWLAPDAQQSSAAVGTEDARELAALLAGAADDDVLGDLTHEPGDTGGLPALGTAAAAERLAGDDLENRLVLVRRALAADNDPKTAAALAGQLATVGSLPVDVRLQIAGVLQRVRPAGMATLGESALKTADSVLHGSGYMLLALAGDAGFAQLLQSQPKLAVDNAQMALQRARDLAVAIVFYPTADLVAEGRRRITAWNRKDDANRTAFARISGGDAELVTASGPYLDAEAVHERICWLAYLRRHAPAEFSRQFLREWVRLGNYDDYGRLTILNLWAGTRGKQSPASVDAQVSGWYDLRARLRAVRALTIAEAAGECAARPAEAAAALAECRFAPDLRAAVNLLGDRPAGEAVKLLQQLAETAHPDLQAFAAERLAATPAGGDE